MPKIWKKRSEEEIKKQVFEALGQNINYHHSTGVLGVPASYLDERVFNQDAAFLKDAPYMYALTQNPNHIGCHTLGKSEHFFKGTQEIERELLEIAAVDILKGEEGAQDGYVASGGTEANIQAIWIYRNYYQQEFGAQADEIVILCSADSHYSIDKAANLLVLDLIKIPVQGDNRKLIPEVAASAVKKAIAGGKKYFIVVCNMMTTMFGSVDDIDVYTAALKNHACIYRIHVDGAYGGFYYPFTELKDSKLAFSNPEITSFTLDAHKMAQSPYGTGIFLIRKGFMHYANTREASYVEGEDFTLIGSRSGANAIAVWMILSKNGPYGWFEKILVLQNRTQWLCQQLKVLDIEYYRNPCANIVSIKSSFIAPHLAEKYGLVPDNHHKPNWYKVVLMEHVTIEKLNALLDDYKKLIPTTPNITNAVGDDT